MAKESEKITRVDVRIPNEIYEQINQIAIETNQPVHHRSGKPVVTPIILNLINLGLEAVEKEDFNLERLTDKQSGKNQIYLKAIEDKVTANLADKISGINQINVQAIEDKVTDNLADKISGINQVEIEAIEKKLLASIEDKFESIVEAKINEVLDHISLSNTENEVDEKIKSQSISYFPEEGEEDIEAELEIRSDTSLKEDNLQWLEDTAVKKEENEHNQLQLIEDTLNNLSLNQTKLAKRLGYKTHSTVSTNFKKMSKEEFINWSKGKDPEGKGWYKVGGKFEVVGKNKI